MNLAWQENVVEGIRSLLSVLSNHEAIFSKIVFFLDRLQSDAMALGTSRPISRVRSPPVWLLLSSSTDLNVCTSSDRALRRLRLPHLHESFSSPACPPSRRPIPRSAWPSDETGPRVWTRRVLWSNLPPSHSYPSSTITLTYTLRRPKFPVFRLESHLPQSRVTVTVCRFPTTQLPSFEYRRIKARWPRRQWRRQPFLFWRLVPPLSIRSMVHICGTWMTFSPIPSFFPAGSLPSRSPIRRCPHSLFTSGESNRDIIAMLFARGRNFQGTLQEEPCSSGEIPCRKAQSFVSRSKLRG